MFPPSTSPPEVNITALSSFVLSLSVMVTAVAIAAVPVQDPEEPDVFPVTLPVIFPAKVPESTSVD